MRRLTLLLGIILLSGLFLIAGARSLSHAQAPVGDTLVCFRRGVDVYCVERSLPSDGDVTQRLQAALEALVVGPTVEEQAAGVWSAIPSGSRLVQLSVEGARVSIYLDLPEEFLTQEFNPLLSDQVVEQIVKTTQPFRAELMAAAGIPDLAWDSGGCSRLVYMAFPFETINTPATRGEVMSRILNFLAPCGTQRIHIYLPIVVKEMN